MAADPEGPPWDDQAYEAAAQAHYGQKASSASVSTATVPGQLNALYKVERDNGKSHWLRIGVAFPNRNGNGYTLSLDAIPLNFTGKILLANPLK